VGAAQSSRQDLQVDMMANTRDSFRDLIELPPAPRMPFMFVGHGSPMNAIEDNVFNRGWSSVGKRLQRPNAILCISAHWLTPGSTQVTAMEVPRTIHDFYGFPKELFDVKYAAPGSPDYAEQTIRLIRKAEAIADYSWGLDHGTWSVLNRMFPEADIPTYQLSIDYSKAPRYHYELAKDLKPLRDRGVLVIGSGNLVHNLQALRMSAAPYDWAAEFDAAMTSRISGGDDVAVVDFAKLGRIAALAHPTPDHFLPLVYALGLRDARDEVEYFNDELVMSSISMRSVLAVPR
jgi:4,5-DOPA dioxygenase extradiol